MWVETMYLMLPPCHVLLTQLQQDPWSSHTGVHTKQQEPCSCFNKLKSEQCEETAHSGFSVHSPQKHQSSCLMNTPWDFTKRWKHLLHLTLVTPLCTVVVTEQTCEIRSLNLWRPSLLPSVNHHQLQYWGHSAGAAAPSAGSSVFCSCLSS